MNHLESNQASEANPMIPASRAPSRPDTPVYELRSLVGPVPPPPLPSPAVRTRTRNCFHITRKNRGWWIFGIALNIIYVVLLAGLTYVCANQLPRTFLNRTLGRWIGYIAFVITFGLFVGFFNASAAMDKPKRASRSGGHIIPHRVLPEIIAMCQFSIILGLFWFIAIPLSYIAQLFAYSRACNTSWLEVELHRRNYRNQTGSGLAHFSIASTKEPLFTFSTPFNSSTFTLEGSVPPNSSLVPALDRIQFDYTTNHIQSMCYNDTTFGSSCGVEGYVWPYDGLEFGLTFSGPDGSRTVSFSRNAYDYWSFGNVPYILLHEVSSTSNKELGARLLSTSSLKRQNCHVMMKVCVSARAGMVGGVVGPDVLVPVGWILEKLSRTPIKCTHSNSR